MILAINVAMTNGQGLAKVGATIHSFPPLADAIRQLGDPFNKTKLTPFSQ